jgi:carboxypeptidase PM20D1
LARQKSRAEDSVKDNVIPTKAEAVVNFRILPGETSNDVIKHIQKVISDERVKLSTLGDTQEASPVSPTNSPGFEIIHKTIKQVFPEVVLNPTCRLDKQTAGIFRRRAETYTGLHPC